MQCAAANRLFRPFGYLAEDGGCGRRFYFERVNGADTMHAPVAVRRIVGIAGLQSGERLQVFAQHLGCDGLHDGQWRQTRDVCQAFRKYLECGIFAHCFVRARCDDSGA